MVVVLYTWKNSNINSKSRLIFRS